MKVKFNKKKASQKSEKHIAKVLGGQVQPASGALPIAALKGDVKTPHYLVEDKITDKGSFSINAAYWQKHSAKAWQQHKHPVMSINLNGGRGPTLYVIDESTIRWIADVIEKDRLDV